MRGHVPELPADEYAIALADREDELVKAYTRNLAVWIPAAFERHRVPLDSPFAREVFEDAFRGLFPGMKTISDDELKLVIDSAAETARKAVDQAKKWRRGQ